MNRRTAVAIAAAFFGICVIFDMWGDTNPRSRLALLASIREGQGFKIDGYETWTIDWARTPDGHYYSNKPPGPTFLALPAYALIDLWITRNARDRTSRDEARLLWSERTSQALSLLLQIIPFIALFFWGLRQLRTAAVSENAEKFFGLAFFFGTTITLLMNTFFGHGIAAVFATALLFSLLDRRWFVAGTCFGWGVLSDYGSALLLPGTLFILFQSDPKPLTHRLVRFVGGGVLPGLLWIAYHHTCFGGPFSIANRFQNPLFVETSQSTALWGIFGQYPRPDVIFQLLFGPSRGVLFTQPWILIVLFSLPALVRNRDRMTRYTAAFCGSGFLLLLGMNASFLNWHSGGGPGPRYLSAILPVFSLIGSVLWRSRTQLRLPLATSLGATLLFASLVLASHRIQNPEFGAIWLFFGEQVFFTEARMPLIRFGAFWALMAGLLFHLYRKRNR